MLKIVVLLNIFVTMIDYLFFSSMLWLIENSKDQHLKYTKIDQSIVYQQ